MRIATWNVNSVKARLAHVLAWLDEAKPDVLCLQEIKCLADDFPRLEVATLGYKVEALGQRAYNGVAILSKEPPRDLVRGLDGDDGDDGVVLSGVVPSGTFTYESPNWKR